MTNKILMGITERFHCNKDISVSSTHGECSMTYDGSCGMLFGKPCEYYVLC